MTIRCSLPLRRIWSAWATTDDIGRVSPEPAKGLRAEGKLVGRDDVIGDTRRRVLIHPLGDHLAKKHLASVEIIPELFQRRGRSTFFFPLILADQRPTASFRKPPQPGYPQRRQGVSKFSYAGVSELCVAGLELLKSAQAIQMCQSCVSDCGVHKR